MDDEKLERVLIRNGFDWSQNGFEIIGEAQSGQEALEFVQYRKPDIVLTDISMPEMDGLEATRQIRALTRKDAKIIPIIAMTADAFEENIREAKDAGMNAYITKPVEPGKMFETLQRYIKK